MAKFEEVRGFGDLLGGQQPKDEKVQEDQELTSGPTQKEKELEKERPSNEESKESPKSREALREALYEWAISQLITDELKEKAKKDFSNFSDKVSEEIKNKIEALLQAIEGVKTREVFKTYKKADLWHLERALSNEKLWFRDYRAQEVAKRITEDFGDQLKAWCRENRKEAERNGERYGFSPIVLNAMLEKALKEYIIELNPLDEEKYQEIHGYEDEPAGPGGKFMRGEMTDWD